MSLPRPHPPREETVTEIEILKKFALRWAILAAWRDELADRHTKVPWTCQRALEKARIQIASGCFGSCEVGGVLSKIEADLASADGSSEDCRASTWTDLLGKAMSGLVAPESLLGVAAIRFRYAGCGRGVCACTSDA